MSPIVDYTLSSIIWAGAGLVIGFAFGRLTRTVDQLAENVETITEAVTEGGDIVTDRPVRARRRRVTYEQVIGAVVVVLGIFTAAQGLYQDSATRKVADCTRAYADGFADALDARSDANAQAQQALDDLMTTVGKLTQAAATPESRAEFRAALAEYLAKRAEAKKQQAENPFPPAPRDVCG